MSLHQILAGLLNDYSYTTIVQVLNEMTEEMFNHHSRNYNDMVQSRLEHFFTDSAAQMNAVDLSTVHESCTEPCKEQMCIDVAMLGSKSIDIKQSKRPEPATTVSVQKSEAPTPDPQQTTVPAPKKLKKPVAKAKRV